MSADFKPHPLVSNIINALTKLSTIQPAELSDADLSAVLSAIISTQTVVYMELSTRGRLVHVIAMAIGEALPDEAEMLVAIDKLFSTGGEG